MDESQVSEVDEDPNELNSQNNSMISGESLEHRLLFQYRPSPSSLPYASPRWT